MRRGNHYLAVIWVGNILSWKISSSGPRSKYFPMINFCLGLGCLGTRGLPKQHIRPNYSRHEKNLTRFEELVFFVQKAKYGNADTQRFYSATSDQTKFVPADYRSVVSFRPAIFRKRAWCRAQAIVAGGKSNPQGLRNSCTLF